MPDICRTVDPGSNTREAAQATEQGAVSQRLARRETRGCREAFPPQSSSLEAPLFRRDRKARLTAWLKYGIPLIPSSGHAKLNKESICRWQDS
jgi:hypothetical protein